jgi:imidazole glycerol-phosphate synthase subunit HisF
MRIIARLDIKTGMLIKSVQFDGQRKIGEPKDFAQNYYDEKIDEIFLINNTGSLYDTLLELDIIKKIRSLVSIPIAGGGGIKTVQDAEKLFNSGCDKIVMNTLLYENPKVFSEIVSIFGSSSVVGSIQYNQKNDNLTYYKMARELTGMSLDETINKNIEFGCGELLITEINRDGHFSGLDKKLINTAKKFSHLPILIGGGFIGKKEIDDFKNVISAIVISSAFHYKKIQLKNLIDYRNLLFNNFK